MQMLEVDERMGVLEEMKLQMLLSGVGSVGSLVYTWIGLHGTRVEGHNRPDFYADKVLSYCERYGWIEDPALLIILLDKIGESPKSKYAKHIPSVAVRLRGKKPDVASFFRNSTAWETCHLSLALPFLNRDITRIALQQFFNPLLDVGSGQAARALVVNGPSGSGKTFTGDFLRLLIGLRAGVNGIAEADFAVFTGDPLTPDRLAIHLSKQMGVDEVRAEADLRRFRATRPERWAKDIAIWLAAEATRTGKTWHLFLDNFHRPGVPEATYIFIDLLLAALENQESIAWDVRDPIMGVPLRLVLAGHTRNLPENNRMLRLDEIKPITTENLKQHFRRYFSYKDWPVNETEIGAIVARYEPRLPSLFPASAAAPSGINGDSIGPPWKMRELADVVLRDCEALELGRTSAPDSEGRNGL